MVERFRRYHPDKIRHTDRRTDGWSDANNEGNDSGHGEHLDTYMTRKTSHLPTFHLYVAFYSKEDDSDHGEHPDTYMTRKTSHLPTFHLHVAFHSKGNDSSDRECLCTPGVHVKDGENPQTVGMGRILNPFASVWPQTTLSDLWVDGAVITLQVTFATVSVEERRLRRLIQLPLKTKSRTWCKLPL